MIDTLVIKGFKSIREVHLDCKRINLFIGEPNTGKSNILEALGFLSWWQRGAKRQELSEYVRCEQERDLFYDGVTTQGSLEIEFTSEQDTAKLTGWFSEGVFHQFLERPGHFTDSAFDMKWFDRIRFYRFQTLAKYPSDDTDYLLPTKGENLAALLRASKEIGRLAREYFTPSGLVLVVKPQEQKIEIQKQADGVAVSFPYSNSSDTLQRMIFYMAAIESNRNAALVFEEPETHAFPYYTKLLGESISLDANKNQYFIATHNPYLLTAIWEKAAAGEIAVFATYYRNYETRVKLLTEEDMAWLFEADPFLGVSHLVEEAQ